MTTKIFKSILSVAAVVLLLSLITVTGVLYQHFSNIQQQQLRDELVLASEGTELLNIEYLKRLPSDQYRLTWIDSDGSVLYDSHANEGEMDNHSDREEIQEAMAYGKGSSVRQSSTLTQKTVYEAMRLDDGSVLRISTSRTAAFVLVFGMVQPITIVILVAIALSAWLAYRISNRIVEPLNCLNLEKPMENECYEEISPLLHRIHAQNLEIKDQLQTLRHKQDEFEQITENMKEALVLLDDHECILSINPAAKLLFDANDQCIGEDFFTIDRKQDIRQAILDAKEKGQTYFRSKKNNRDYQFDVSCITSDGQNRGTVILAFDVTEQVNAETHRKEFTANVSHELKTPLQSIIGYAELMSSGIAREEDVPRFLKNIQKEGSRLVVLIDDIIRLSQLDEGVEMPREMVSLHDITVDVFESLEDAASRKGISLEVEGDHVIIEGVRRLLIEMIYNLCENAIKYNNVGGYVRVKIKELGNSILLSVEDNGIGIAPEHQDKVFERFYRVDKSHSKESGGTGLGMSIVKHAAQYHHGAISLESALNQGTKISILFN